MIEVCKTNLDMESTPLEEIQYSPHGDTEDQVLAKASEHETVEVPRRLGRVEALKEQVETVEKTVRIEMRHTFQFLTCKSM